MLEFTIPLYYTQGGGESLDQLYDRCTAALERIGGMHKGMGAGSLQNPYVVKCLLVCELNDPILFSIVEIQMSTSENCSSTMLSNVTFFSVAIVMQSLNYSLNYVCLSKSNLAQ